MASTLILTGSNGSLGNSIVEKVIKGPRSTETYGVYAVRNPANATALQAILKRAPKDHRHETLKLDLASLKSAREAAAEVNKKVSSGELPPVRALVLAAGFQEWEGQSFTEDGFDMSYQANFLSHFLFTLLILQSMDKEHGRIVIVGSWTHDAFDKQNDMTPGGSPFKGEFSEFIKGGTSEGLAKGTWSLEKDHPASGFRRYGAGKFCEVLWMHALNARLAKDPALGKITVAGIDPGAMPSTLSRRAAFFVRVVLQGLLMPLVARISTFFQPNGTLRTTAKSAGDTLDLAYSDSGIIGQRLADRSKPLYMNGSEVRVPSAESQDEAKQDILWRDAIRFANVKEGETVLKDWQ